MRIGSIHKNTLFALAAGAIAFGVTTAGTGDAANAAPKQVTVVVGHGAGGGFDQYGRLTARFMEKHLPGKPTVVVQNMPGAGGIKSLTWLSTAAPRDGSAIASMAGGAVFAKLQGDKVPYDAKQFNYLVSLDRLANLLIVWHKTPFTNVKDAFDKEIIIANSGGATAIIPVMLNRIIGTRFKVIAGYKGTNEIMLALERGEGDGAINLSWTSITAKPQLLQDNLIRMLMQLTFEPIDDPRVKGIPTLNGFVTDGVGKDMLEILLAKQELGRSFIAPPGLSADLVKTYRDSMMNLAKDPEFRAEADKQKLSLDVTPGEKVQAYVERIYSVPESTVQKLHEEMELAKQGVEERKK